MGEGRSFRDWSGGPASGARGAGLVSYDEGLDVGYRWYDATGQRPLFPFGYGLSYQRFDVLGARAFYSRSSGTAFVLARVRNTSGQAGAVTLELFLSSPAGRAGAAEAAQGLCRRDVAAGQSKFVVFRLKPSDLAYFNATSGRWTVAPGRYTVRIGTSSTELDNAANFEVGRPGHRH